MIWNIFAFSALKIVFRLGLTPNSVMIRKALKALRKDDLNTAIDAYIEAARRDYGAGKVQVLREILVSELIFRKETLEKRLGELDADTGKSPEIASTKSAIDLLDKMLGRMGKGMRQVD